MAFPPYLPPLGEGVAVWLLLTLVDALLVELITGVEIGNGFGGLCPGGGGLFAEVGVPAGVVAASPPP